MRRTTSPLATLLLFLISLAWSAGCSNPVDEVAPPDASAATELEPVAADENDWPWWRGPQRNNVAAGTAPPLTWSPDENVVWRADIPGEGHATPIVWKDMVFVFTAIEDEKAHALLCLDRASGETRWATALHEGDFMHAHHTNSHASATPATDGERVFVTLIADGAVRTFAVDFEGQIVWQKESGAFKSQHGYGSSPLIWQSLVIVLGDTGSGGFITAHNRRTGEIVWRTRRASSPSYATPIAANVGGADRLIVSGQGDLVSYDPLTGERQWKALGPADITGNTLAWSDGLLFAGGGYPQRGLWAVQADDGERVWKLDFKQYVPSPLAFGGRVYAVQDGGVMRCIDAKSGEEIWKKRLGGNFSASPVMWQDRIYVPNESGTMFVVRASDEFEKLAENDLDGGGMASPVICAGQLYVRTASTLWRLGSPIE